ncbi:hypothetical protein [Rubrivivax albus]|uniref:Uncharacterized protein n=1 Tax=Rubrivivax albus TaxID=2499835 RepID=A0A3S2TQM7_9BURK|nr:hypothetical protein [Rubrivivax albus]RVT51278.1 hypothetical protein ENE75_10550 [Rubrivivax albus]
MNREERNEKVRKNLIDLFASTKLSRPLLEKHARLLVGVAKTPLDDFIHASRHAGIDLMAAVTEPGTAALYVDTELAIKLILSVGLLRTEQKKLEGPKTDKEKEERDRAVKAHRDAEGLAREVKSRGFTIEKFHEGIAKVDSPELVKRMMFSPTAAGKIVTADGKTLDPINLPTKKLNSDGQHRVRISVVEVSPSGTHAMVKLKWAEHPANAAIKDLLKRSSPLRLEYRRFKGVDNLSDLLLSLRLARREADVIVTVTRALRPSDKDLDLLVLKEFCGLRELAVAVPDDLQRIQEELWGSLR